MIYLYVYIQKCKISHHILTDGNQIKLVYMFLLFKVHTVVCAPILPVFNSPYECPIQREGLPVLCIQWW